MKRSTLGALLAPIVIFGLLYLLTIEPQREAARAAREQLAEANEALGRERTLVRSASKSLQTSALSQFDSRTADSDRVGEVAASVEALLKSPAVGGVANLSIETGAEPEGPLNPRIRSFGRELAVTRVSMSFEGRYDQIGRFFWNLRALPTTFELQSVELTPGRTPPLMHARVVLRVLQRKAPGPQAQTAQPVPVDLGAVPEWTRNPFAPARQTPVPTPARNERVLPAQPDPRVSGILYSSGRRVALIDGRIVRAGDRVGSAVVRSIEPDAVVLSTGDGHLRRLELERPITDRP